MTTQKLYETLNFLQTLDQRLGLQKALDSIKNTLNNLVSQPALPQHQSALANAIQVFASAATKMGEAITPSQAAHISEMGGEEFFDPLISDKVEDSIAKNAMTPSVARDFVQDLTSRRSEFMATVAATFRGLTNLKITESRIEPGSVDVAFLIPRNLFDNQLGTFAKELVFINSLVRDISEATTGHAESIELRELSSSVPTISVVASGAVILAFAEIVNKFLDAWKKIEEIREIRERLTKIGIKGAAYEELTEEISSTVEEVVEESMTTLLVEYKGDGGRKNELSNALNQDMQRLFGQIERGLTVEFHAESRQDEHNEEDRKALEAVSALGRKMRFPQVGNEPLLLTNGEVVEGRVDGLKISKKTTLRKSSKKETHKEVKPEPKGSD